MIFYCLLSSNIVEKMLQIPRDFQLIPREISRLIFFWWRLDPARCTFHRFRKTPKFLLCFFLPWPPFILLKMSQGVTFFWHTKAHSMIQASQRERWSVCKISEKNSEKQTFSLTTHKLLKNVKIQSVKFTVHRVYLIKRLVAQRGARTHDPEIKSLMLYRLS